MNELTILQKKFKVAEANIHAQELIIQDYIADNLELSRSRNTAQQLYADQSLAMSKLQADYMVLVRRLEVVTSLLIKKNKLVPQDNVVFKPPTEITEHTTSLLHL